MRMTTWPFLVPLAGLSVLGVTFLVQPGAMLLLLSGAALLGSVVSAVHHAEVVAHRVGEPFGTLILALAVTIIEAALVLSMMLADGEFSSTVARDAIYSAVMIICNGVVGLCLLVGGLRHLEQAFRVEGTGSGLAALAALCTLVLVAPTLTVGRCGWGLYDLPARFRCNFIAGAMARLHFHTDGTTSRLLSAGRIAGERGHSCPAAGRSRDVGKLCFAARFTRRSRGTREGAFAEHRASRDRR